ncbi:cell division cycle-associated protein 2 isoform X2 [Thalassophryne amazonica]|uniref:cell division cycle-associated protein 2 isoform X2 n=1 Tax=Thalassophryne amazonica TaxID=390379 RepID=UPI0014711130|nr:cell division cycle-associated protein 2 isoform X2 [Thalassophryne amazonica]
MAAIEMNTTTTGGVTEVTMMPSSEQDCTDASSDTLPPLNFLHITPSHFGISVQSFTPVSSLSKCKDKSRLAELKARRRSSVGVRGSPTTNSLIRFMAQQKMMTPPAQRTAEFVQSSHFLSQPTSTLRQKMASFQNLIEAEETEVCDLMSKQDSDTRGCIKTRVDLSDVECPDGEKENHPPSKKKRLVGPCEGCEVEISRASSPILHTTLKEQEESCYERSVRQQHENPATTPPAQPASLFPSALEMKPTGGNNSSDTTVIKKKKKQVRFGGPLSPQVFDQSMPPNTPLQKGGTPARPPTPGEGLQPRSVLKTPQWNGPQSPQTQPDFSPTVFGASPTLVMPRCARMRSVGGDDAEYYGKIPLLSFEEVDCAVINNTESSSDPEPLNLGGDFQKESISQTLSDVLSGSEVASSLPPQLHSADELPFLPMMKQLDFDVQAESCTQKKKLEPECETATETETPTRPSMQKRKREQIEPVKRSSRTAAKSACEKMKTSKQTCQWRKAVDRSLYGARKFASKNPDLSPITESLFFLGPSSSCRWSPSKSYTATSHQNLQRPDVSAPVAAELTDSSSSFTDNTHDVSDVSLSHFKTRSKAGRKRRSSGPSKAAKGGRRKMSVMEELSEESGDQQETEKQTHEVCEFQSAANVDRSEDTPPEPTAAPGQRAEPRPQTPVSTDDTAAGVTGHDASTSVCSPLGAILSNISATLSSQIQSAQTDGKSTPSRGTHSRRSMYRPHPQEQENQPEPQVANEVVEHERDPDTPPEVGLAGLGLAPWQADFNLEDVFKPVAARGQRSVRRSLRNQNNTDDGATSSGLTWLPWISPDVTKKSRRRTRGRRISDATPVQPELLQETPDDPPLDSLYVSLS